jgi:hypothetical protein
MQVFGFGKKRPAVNDGLNGLNGLSGINPSHPYGEASSPAPDLAPAPASASAPRVQPAPRGKYSPAPARNPLQESPVENRSKGSFSVRSTPTFVVNH